MYFNLFSLAWFPVVRVFGTGAWCFLLFYITQLIYCTNSDKYYLCTIAQFISQIATIYSCHRQKPKAMRFKRYIYLHVFFCFFFLFFFKRWEYCERLHLSVRPSFKPTVRPIVRPSVVCPSVCPSRYLLLNHLAEFRKTCYITSPYGKGMQEQHFFFCASVRPYVRRPSICSSRYLS